jgi:hypothetical protein
MSMDSYIAGTLIIGTSVVLAVVGMLAVRKNYNVQALVSAHEISGQYLSIVGTLYAVLLGLIVVDAMGRFDRAVEIVEDEANAIAQLVYLSGRMPAATGAKVRELAVAYIHLVIDKEWATLKQGRPHEQARVCAFELMSVARDWEPVSESEKATYAAAISVASEIWNARRHRILASLKGIPALEWCVVIVGGIVTVGLTYVFVFDDLRVQITLTAMVALLISLNIFLVMIFGHPFSGDLSVNTVSFKATLYSIPLATRSSETH